MDKNGMYANGVQQSFERNKVLYLHDASAETAREDFYHAQQRRFRLQRKIAQENLRIRQTITAAFLGLFIALIVITLLIVINWGF